MTGTDSLRERQREIVEEFALLDDWMLRYQQMIEHGERLSPMAPEFKTDDRLVKGCQSRVWIRPYTEAGRFRVEADSESALVKGLASLIVRVVDDQPPGAVAEAELSFLDELELADHLSPNRANGLHAMVETIRRYARAAAA